MVNSGVLVFVISKTKTRLSLDPLKKTIRKIYMKWNYDRSKNIIRT